MKAMSGGGGEVTRVNDLSLNFDASFAAAETIKISKKFGHEKCIFDEK